MPVSNGQAYLTRSLDSIRNQTYRDLEIVVINDGSTDDTAEILRAYAAKEPRLRVCHQEHDGLASALNHCCRKARGVYLARMDADDIAYPERIAAQVDYLTRHPNIAALGTQARLIPGHGPPSPYITRMPVSPAEVRRCLRRRNALVHPSVMMRRDAYEETTGYRRALAAGQDYDLWLRMLERHDLANLPTLMLDYTVHAAQVSSQMLERQALGALAAQLAARNRGLDNLDTINAITHDVLHQLGASDNLIEQASIEAYAEMANRFWTVGERSQADALLDAVSPDGLSRTGARRLRSERLWLEAKRASTQGRRVECCWRMAGACVIYPAAVSRILRVLGRRR